MKICPICRKATLEAYMGGILGEYRCKNCGYVGPIALEIYQEKRKNKKSGKKMSSKAGRKISKHTIQ